MPQQGAVQQMGEGGEGVWEATSCAGGDGVSHVGGGCEKGGSRGGSRRRGLGGSD